VGGPDELAVAGLHLLWSQPGHDDPPKYTTHTAPVARTAPGSGSRPLRGTVDLLTDLVNG
jgi:hypothetical protein